MEPSYYIAEKNPFLSCILNFGLKTNKNNNNNNSNERKIKI